MALLPSETDDLISKASKCQYVRFVWPDINGIARGRTLINNGDVLSNSLKYGIGCYDRSFYLGPDNELPNHLESSVLGNCQYKPAANKLRTILWSGGKDCAYGEVLCEPTDNNGDFLNTNPRYVARRQLRNLKDMGYKLLSSFEVECYILHKETLEPLGTKPQFYNTFSLAKHEPMFFEFEQKLKKYGIDLETMQCEYCPGQFEFTFVPSYGIASADTYFCFKEAMKELCDEKGYLITFMTQPLADALPNGTHFNHSLWRIDDGRNALFDGDKTDHFSDLCRYFIAGILKNAQAISAFCCPTTNCYRRVNSPVPVTPTKIEWGIERRTVMLRAKYIPNQCNTYLENRLPSGSSNPYLVLAATVAAGIDGIKTRAELPPEGNHADATPLPLNLSEALDALEKNGVMTDALGNEFVESFIKCRRVSGVDKFGGHNLKESNKSEIDIERKAHLNTCEDEQHL